MLWVRIGVYHTQFLVAYFLVSTLLSKIFDVGNRDLPVLTSGNWVKAEWLSGLWNYVRFLRFLRFFQNPKNMTFYFLSSWPRFLDHWRARWHRVQIDGGGLLELKWTPVKFSTPVRLTSLTQRSIKPSRPGFWSQLLYRNKNAYP